MARSFNPEVSLASGGPDEKRLFQIKRLKPPAEIYFPPEAFYLPPKNFKWQKALHGCAANFSSSAGGRRKRSTIIVFDVT
jgi:hypothetical protein